MPGPISTCNDKVFFKQPMPVNTFFYSLYYPFQCSTFLHSFILFRSCNKVFYYIQMYYWLLDYHLILFVQDCSHVFCLLMSYMCLLGSVVLYFTVRMPSISVYGIHNSAWLPPGTTKSLHTHTHTYISYCNTVYP